MVFGMKPQSKQGDRGKKAAVTLKSVAECVGLTASTVSAVLNNSSASQWVPERTKKRILAAARDLNYRPNFFARLLRVKRTYTIGVLLTEIGDAYGSVVISGMERYLREQNFFFLTVTHRHDKKLLATYSAMLLERGVEGFITVDTSLTEQLTLPTVAVAGHRRIKGVTNIVLDHRRAAWLALTHLVDLGHKKIAFMKGSAVSADSDTRWNAICEVATELGIPVRPELIVQLEGMIPRRIWATRLPGNCWPVSSLLPRWLPATIFPRLVPSALSWKQACVCRTTCRWWASTTFRTLPISVRRSRL
jgi:DNA-binding LacI/PurR family transcriptional regulator